jgi:methylamine utilization protein MauE
VTLAGLLRILLAAVLIGAAVAKITAGAGGREALRTYGVSGARSRAALWVALIVTELGLGAAVAAGIPHAAAAAAALLGVFALALATALARGRAGAPCGCLGARSRVSPGAVARTAALALAFAAAPGLPAVEPSTESWLIAGLTVAFAGLAALTLALLALAREVGELRLAVAPQAALSVSGEGPEIGARTALRDRFAGSAPLALAVFTSAGCPLCEALEPAVQLVGADPHVELEVFDEQEHGELWHELGIPGSPYGVVVDAEGTVLSKGTFNTLLQLEGVLAAAERRLQFAYA